MAHLSDKEIGLVLDTMPKEIVLFLFGYRKGGRITERQRAALMRLIRPTDNALSGYVPSYTMGRILDDAAS